MTQSCACPDGQAFASHKSKTPGWPTSKILDFHFGGICFNLQSDLHGGNTAAAVSLSVFKKVFKLRPSAMITSESFVVFLHWLSSSRWRLHRLTIDSFVPRFCAAARFPSWAARLMPLTYKLHYMVFFESFPCWWGWVQTTDLQSFNCESALHLSHNFIGPLWTTYQFYWSAVTRQNVFGDMKKKKKTCISRTLL